MILMYFNTSMYVSKISHLPNRAHYFFRGYLSPYSRKLVAVLFPLVYNLLYKRVRKKIILDT